MFAMIRYVTYRTRTEPNNSFLELIQARDANGGGLDNYDSIIVINTFKHTASIIELHSPVIYGISSTLVSEQTTELSPGPEVVSSRFQTMEYCLPKTELLKTKVMLSLEVVSSRFKTMVYCLPQTELLRIEIVSSLKVVPL